MSQVQFLEPVGPYITYTLRLILDTPPNGFQHWSCPKSCSVISNLSNLNLPKHQATCTTLSFHCLSFSTRNEMNTSEHVIVLMLKQKNYVNKWFNHRVKNLMLKYVNTIVQSEQRFLLFCALLACQAAYVEALGRRLTRTVYNSQYRWLVTWDTGIYSTASIYVM